MASSNSEDARLLLKSLRTNRNLAKLVFEMMYDSYGLDDQISTGFLDKLSLSNLPFNAVARLEDFYPKLVSRLSTHHPSVASVRLVVTPSIDFRAKMHLGRHGAFCCISIGLITIAQCVVLCLVCRQSLFKGYETIRERLARDCGLRIELGANAKAYRDQYRGPEALPFIEGSPILEALGIEANEINRLLKDASYEDFVLADVLWSEIVRFFVCHELAHFTLGHPQLLKLWIDCSQVAEKHRLAFPSADARRAMESVADLSATEWLLYLTLCPECSILNREIFRHRPSPLQKTYVAVIAVQIAFFLLGATDTVTSMRSALFQDLGDALSGAVRDMYPGFAVRSSYATAMAMKSFPRTFSHLRLLRWWWRMGRDLATVDTTELGVLVFEAWHAAGLKGHLPVLTDNDPTAIAVATDSSPMSSAVDALPAGWRGKIGGFREYISAHREINRDLEIAKIWWTSFSQRSAASR